MAKVWDLDDLNPGTWFDFDEESEAEVCLRVCAEEDRERIQEQVTKKKVDFKKGGRWPYEVTDNKKQNQLIWDFCIMDWRGFKDKAGNDIICNKDSKLKLMNKSLEFAKFIGEKLSELAEIEVERAELDEKN